MHILVTGGAGYIGSHTCEQERDVVAALDMQSAEVHTQCLQPSPSLANLFNS